MKQSIEEFSKIPHGSFSYVFNHVGNITDQIGDFKVHLENRNYTLLQLCKQRNSRCDVTLSCTKYEQKAHVQLQTCNPGKHNKHTVASE